MHLKVQRASLKRHGPVEVVLGSNRRRVEVDAAGSSLVWAGFAMGLAAWLLVLFNGPRRTHRLDLTWRARLFVLVVVGAAAFLIALIV